MTPERRAYDLGMPSPGHKVSPERLEEFRRIYKKVYGEEITIAKASEMAHRLLMLYQLLMRLLPDKASAPSPSLESPAQTASEAS